MKARLGTLGSDASDGLPGQRSGTLVAWTAKPGTLAHDGSERNNPTTEALLRHLEEPGPEVGG